MDAKTTSTASDSCSFERANISTGILGAYLAPNRISMQKPIGGRPKNPKGDRRGGFSSWVGLA